MVNINFTIDNGKIDRIKNALKSLYPIPTINNGTEEEPDIRPEFTDNEWAKECVRRWVIGQVARWEKKIGNDAVIYHEDDNLFEEDK